MNHEHQRDYFERRSELRQSIDRAIELKEGVTTRQKERVANISDVTFRFYHVENYLNLGQQQSKIFFVKIQKKNGRAGMSFCSSV